MRIPDTRLGPKNNPQMRKIDAVEFTAPIYVTSIGHEYRKKPGRRKKLSAEQGARLFDLQAQKRTADRLIRELLLEAGYLDKSGWARILNQNIEDRGRVDVLHPAKAK